MPKLCVAGKFCVKSRTFFFALWFYVRYPAQIQRPQSESAAHEICLMTRLPGVSFLLSYLAVMIIVVAGVFAVSLRDNLGQLSETGAVRLAQAADRLQGQLESYRELPNFLARHPNVIAMLDGRATVQSTNEFLLNMALTSGAEGIYLLNGAGQVIATSNFEDAANNLGQKFPKRPDFVSGMNGGLGFFHGLDRVGRGRDFFYSRGVISGVAPPVGVVVVKVDLAQVEFEWRIDEDVVAFFDHQGVAFVSNRPGLLLRRIVPDGATPPPKDPFRPFYPLRRRQILGYDVWSIKGGDLPQSSLVRARYIPQIDMTARAFMDTSSATRTAALLSALAAALMALLGLGLLVLAERRQRLADRLALEEAANLRLEARVEARTTELHRAQDQLVQAGKMSALGQMSAGISHELNQPLSAIQNFAENGRKFLAMGRHDEAGENLGLIAQQTERMTRIIRNLRAFARKEPEKLEDVDVSQVVADAISLLDIRSREENVCVHREGTKGPVLVVGGRVRLQQVLVNLISNAIDAMDGQADKRVWISVSKAPGAQVRLVVRDNGPGLADLARAFEPFYSTKDVGASNGMGLGLSISYGIIGSFGGDIDVRNHPDGGAEFHITLRAARGEGAP